MAQKRTWNFGDTFSAKKAKDAQKALHLPGRYTGYNATVLASDKISLSSDGVVLLPNGILVSEDTNINITFPTLPSVATVYSITVRHSDINTIGGAPAVYAIETGELPSVLSDGVVICWVYHPGGAVALTNPNVVIRMSDSQQAGSTSGPAGGDLAGNYPNPEVAGIRGVPVSATAPVTSSILQYNGTEYVPVSSIDLVGVGVPLAVWAIPQPVVSSTDYVNGFREFGVAVTLQKVIISQEVAGSAGSLVVQLYKISGLTPYTETLVGAYTIPYTAANKGRVVSTTFNAGTNTLSPNDRLGIKINQVQTGFPALSDVTVTVIVNNNTTQPEIPPDPKSIVQALDSTVIGTSFVQVGSVRLVPGTIHANNSRFLVGTTTALESFVLQIRKFGSVVPILQITGTGLPQEYALTSDVAIFEDSFYDIFIKGVDGPTTTVQIKGFKLIYQPSNRVDINQALSAGVTGSIANVVGSLYLTTGTLQSDSKFLMGTDDSAGVAVMKLRNFTTSELIGSFYSFGLVQVVQPEELLDVPAPGFYDIYLEARTFALGLGVGGITAGVAPSMTIKTATPLFSLSDVGKTFIVAKATSAGNNGTFTITGFTSATEVNFNNASGVAEAFSEAVMLESATTTAMLTGINLTVIP
jgi:hypothetical protein